MQPTPRAVEMGPQVHAALTQLQAALAPADFFPASSERRFALVAGFYACAMLAPPLVARLAQEAPLAELAVAQYTEDVLDRMDAHRVDFLIGGIVGAPERFARDVITTDGMAWVVRADHPLAELEDVDLQALVSAPHVVIAPGLPGSDEGAERRGLIGRASWDDAGALDAALAAEGLRRRIGVSVPDTYSALSVASRSNMAALIPRRLALMSAQGGRLKLIEPPYPSPTVDVSLLYLKERLADPAIAWMRELIRSTGASL